MRVNFTRSARINRLAALALIAACLFQLPGQIAQAAITNMPVAQSSDSDSDGVIAFQDLLIGFVPGERLILTVHNSVKDDQPDRPAGRDEAIRVQMELYNERGEEIAKSPEVEVPPGEFRSVEITRDSLPIAGEPRTGRAQVHTRSKFLTPPLWGVRNRAVATLELVDRNGSTRGGVNFLFGDGSVRFLR